MAFGALSKLIGQNWKNCDEALKANFNEKAAADKERYAAEKKKWEEEKQIIKSQRLLEGLTDSSGSDLSEDSSSSSESSGSEKD